MAIEAGSLPESNAEVAEEAAWYQEQTPGWELGRTLLGGTKAMREAGEAYLPRFGVEGEDDFKRRLAVTTLTNFYRKTARKMAGYIFGSPIKIENSKIPKDLLANVDRRGSSIDLFARKFGLALMTRGLHHIVVDMPKRPAGAVTKGDDKELGLHPFWLSLPAEVVFSAFAEKSAGEERLLQFRWRDDGHKLDGYAIAPVERVRLMNRTGASVTFEVWEKETISIGDKGFERWKLVDSGPLTGVTRIPASTIYAERCGFMISRPPLEDVAYKNVEHWQSSSDQRNILTVSRYPTQYQIGTANPIMETGPHYVLWSPGANGPDQQDVSFGYIEPEGTGIEAGERDLKRLGEEIEAMAMELLIKAPRATVVEAQSDVQSETSPLQDIAQGVEDALNDALGHTAEWLGMAREEGGKATVNKEFGISADDAKAIDAILKMRAAGDLTRETQWGEMKARGVFRTGFDVKAEQDKLAKEEEEAMASLPTALRAGVRPAPGASGGAQPPIEADLDDAV